jgi:hypothetical protein
MSKQYEISFRVKKGENKRVLIKSHVEDILANQQFFVVLPDTLKVTSKSQGGAKAKGIGSEFERRVVKILSEWWQCSLRRVPNSGGWDKQVNDGSVQASGDIWAPPEANFPFSVECKHRKEDLDLFAEQKPGTDCIYDWWKQCQDDAQRAQKEPLLIMCCGRTVYVAFNGFSKLFDVTSKAHYIHAVVESDSQYCFTVMLIENFIKVFPKENVRKI